MWQPYLDTGKDEGGQTWMKLRGSQIRMPGPYVMLATKYQCGRCEARKGARIQEIQNSNLREADSEYERQKQLRGSTTEHRVSMGEQR